MELVSGTWPALCGIAMTLGLRHGFDADHLTVIDGLVRRNAQRRPKLARIAGILFALGHGAVVIMAACTTLVLAASWQPPSWLEPSGVLISAIVLLVLATLNLHAVWATPHGEMVVPVGLRSRLFDRVLAIDHPLVMVGLGVLFAISADTLAQAAALGLAASHFGGLQQAAAVAGCFTVGMVVASGINGLWIARLIQTANRRAAIASRVMAGAVGLTSLAVAMVLLFGLVSPAMGSAIDANAAWAGVAVIAVAAVAFVVAMLISRKPWLERSTRAPFAVDGADRL